MREDSIELAVLTGQRPATDLLRVLPPGWKVAREENSPHDEGVELRGPKGLRIGVRKAQISVGAEGKGNFARLPSVREAARKGAGLVGLSALHWRHDLPSEPGGPYLMAWSEDCAALVEYRGGGWWSYVGAENPIPPTALGKAWAAMPSPEAFETWAPDAQLYLVQTLPGDYLVSTAEEAGTFPRVPILLAEEP